MQRFVIGGTIGSDPVVWQVKGGDLTGVNPPVLRHFRGGQVNEAYIGVYLTPNGVVDKVVNTSTYHMNTYTVSATRGDGLALTPTNVTATQGFIVNGLSVTQDTTTTQVVTITVYTALGIGTASFAVPQPTLVTAVPPVQQPPPTTGSPPTVPTPPQLVPGVNGDLVQHINNRLLAAQVGTTAGTTTLPRFSSVDEQAGTYTKNTQCWAQAFDFSSESPWNSLDGPRRAGTLVSPRHVLFATHYPLTAGTSLRFVGTDGLVYTRTLTQTLVVNWDMSLGLLDSDLPNTVKFAKVMPQSVGGYIPFAQSGSMFRSPPVCFYLDQADNVKVLTWTGVSGVYSYASNAQFGQLAQYAVMPIAGDSGNPWLLPVLDDMVLVGTFYSVSTGPSPSQLLVQLNQAMTTIGGGHQATVVDLSSFNTY